MMAAPLLPMPFDSLRPVHYSIPCFGENACLHHFQSHILHLITQLSAYLRLTDPAAMHPPS